MLFFSFIEQDNLQKLGARNLLFQIERHIANLAVYRLVTPLAAHQ
jgi:hypothetical protein